MFHYEVDEVGQVGQALDSIAQVRPRILVVNGGDGTVQAVLTAIHNGQPFETAPPLAVLPNGKTNLIALESGLGGRSRWWRCPACFDNRRAAIWTTIWSAGR